MVLELITMGAQALSRASIVGYIDKFCCDRCQKLKFFSFRRYFGIVTLTVNLKD